MVRPFRPGPASAFAAAALASLSTSTALATWSMVLTDTRTGEVAVGSCTCLSDLDLQTLTPVLLVGVGAGAAQSAGDSTGLNRTYMRDALLRGIDPTAIITGLATFDSAHQSRQYGMLDITGRTATFTGTGDGQWAGGRTGTFDYEYLGKQGTMSYAIQGNVLTGAPVVDMAVAAARNTPGDLAARFMAAMQAARSMGGDGRCSCGGAPNSCGSPPPNFTFSAQIGYMLIARTGDRNGTHGMYKSGGSPSGFAAGDLNGDGKPELVIVNTGTTVSGLAVLVNATSPFPGDVPTFVLPVSTFSAGNGATDVVIADVTGDGVPDALEVNSQSNTLGMYRGLGNARFASVVTTNTGTGPRTLAVADFDGLNGRDVAIVTTGLAGAGVVTVRLNSGTGTFGAPTDYPIGADPRRIIAVDLDNDTKLDLVVAVRTDNKIKWLRGNGDGTFQPAADLATVPLPTSFSVADVNGDTSLDIVVACQGVVANGRMGVIVLTNSGGTFSSTQIIDIAGQPNDALIGDVSGDGRVDLVIPLSTGMIATCNGIAPGGFGPAVLSNVWTTSLGRGILADLNGDGRLDGAFISSGNSAIAVVRNNGHGLDSGIGNAFGNYFMSFDYSLSQIDPVIDLQRQYDEWRAALVGRPDAVQSIVSAPGVLVPGRAPRTLRVNVRDWQGMSSTHALAGASVQVIDGASSFVSVSSPRFVGTDVIEFSVIGIATGNSTLRITVDDGVRPVTLMPDTRIRVRACLADANNDGGVTIDDLTTFLVQFNTGANVADLDADGGVTIEDLLVFIDAYEAGC